MMPSCRETQSVTSMHLNYFQTLSKVGFALDGCSHRKHAMGKTTEGLFYPLVARGCWWHSQSLFSSWATVRLPWTITLPKCNWCNSHLLKLISSAAAPWALESSFVWRTTVTPLIAHWKFRKQRPLCRELCKPQINQIFCWKIFRG